jgi:hypothetical protein
MKPTVLDQRNPLDLHTLARTHCGLLTRRRAALGAGQADISQTRSSSFPTRVKDVLARAGMVLSITPSRLDAFQPSGTPVSRWRDWPNNSREWASPADLLLMPWGTGGLEGATIEDDRPGAEVHRLTWVDADAFLVHGDGLHVRGDVAADGALFNATLAGDLDGLVTIPG